MELIRLMQHAANHTHQWTKASLKHWEAAIESATKAGLIEQRGELLWLKPEPEPEKKPTQLGLLFE